MHVCRKHCRLLVSVRFCDGVPPTSWTAPRTVAPEWAGFARSHADSLAGACRRAAPPGFRAVPRADFAVTAIRLQSAHAFAPAALRAALASRGKPCGLSPAAMDGAGEHVGACCGRLCECVPSSTLVVLAHHVTKDGSRASRPASLWSFHATPQDRRRKVRQGLSRLSSGG